jgi:hypothetical protein
MPVAAMHVITGIPALLIILLILILLVAGAVSLIRLTARGAKRVVGDGDSDRR